MERQDSGASTTLKVRLSTASPGVSCRTRQYLARTISGQGQRQSEYEISAVNTMMRVARLMRMSRADSGDAASPPVAIRQDVARNASVAPGSMSGSGKGKSSETASPAMPASQMALVAGTPASSQHGAWRVNSSSATGNRMQNCSWMLSDHMWSSGFCSASGEK